MSKPVEIAFLSFKVLKKASAISAEVGRAIISKFWPGRPFGPAKPSAGLSAVRPPTEIENYD